jgi:hypothetical protein
MMMTLLLLLQETELESWARLHYEVETARLAIEDVLAETKRKEIPRFGDGEAGKLWTFRWKHDYIARAERIILMGKNTVPIDDFKAHVKGSPLEMDSQRPPFPEGLAKAARDGFAAAKKKHLESMDAESKVRWIERQIKELYEPLVTLNARGFAAVKGYQKLGEAEDGERAFWKVWAVREFLPRNEETRKVVAAKLFLIEGEGLSEPFLAFLLHQHSWALRHAKWEADKGAYDWGSRTNWPVAFSMECEQTYQKLLDRRARLVAEAK